MDDDSIAHHAHGLFIQDARGHQVQGEFGALVIIDGVPSIGASLHSKQILEGILAQAEGAPGFCCLPASRAVCHFSTHTAMMQCAAGWHSSLLQHVMSPWSARTHRPYAK